MARTSSTETAIKNMLIPLVQAIGRSGKLLYLIIFLIIGYFVYQFFTKKSETSTIEYDTNLIQVQIKNVGKLVVTEGHFAEVLTYKDKKETYIPGLSFDKKALVIINADVTVGFDLSKVTYDIDAKNKILSPKNAKTIFTTPPPYCLKILFGVAKMYIKARTRTPRMICP